MLSPPPPDVVSGTTLFRVTEPNGETPFPGAGITLRFLEGTKRRVLRERVSNRTDADGMAQFDARSMLPAKLFEGCHPVNVLADVEVEVGGNTQQFQAAMDATPGALFWIYGPGRPYEGAAYVSVPQVELSRSWFYPLISPGPDRPESWEAQMKASLLRCLPSDCVVAW
jgi:hypothetical protein